MRAVIYLANPKITRAFAVRVAAMDAESAELTGSDIAAVSMFLRMAPGVPRFDVECDGKSYRRCALSAMPTGNESLPFTFETVSRVLV